MAKVTTNPITRRQKFLGAIAGDNEAPVPITDTERLLHNIAEQVNNGSSSGEQYIVHMTPTSSDGGEMDHTNEEILDAYNAGKTIIFDITMDDINARVQATVGAAVEGVTYPGFSGIVANNSHELLQLLVLPNNEISDQFALLVDDLGGTSESDDVWITFVQGDDVITSDKSYADLRSAYDNGKRIHAQYIVPHTGVTGTRDYVYYAVYIVPPHDDTIAADFYFLSTNNGPAQFVVTRIYVIPSGTINKTVSIYSLS